jgi:hypothetical protein
VYVMINATLSETSKFYIVIFQEVTNVTQLHPNMTQCVRTVKTSDCMIVEVILS